MRASMVSDERRLAERRRPGRLGRAPRAAELELDARRRRCQTTESCAEHRAEQAARRAPSRSRSACAPWARGPARRRAALERDSTSGSSALMSIRVSIGLMLDDRRRPSSAAAGDARSTTSAGSRSMTSSSTATRSSADRRVEAVRQKLSSARPGGAPGRCVNFVGRAKSTSRRRGGRRWRAGGRSSGSSPCLAASTSAAIWSSVRDCAHARTSRA